MQSQVNGKQKISTFGAKLIIMRKYALLYLIAIVLATNAFAQDDFTIGHFQNLSDNDIYFKGINTAIRPATGVENEIYDSLIFPKNDKVEKNWFVRKLFHEHLFIIGNEKYKVYFDPIFDFRYNRLNDLSDPANPTAVNGYTNTRGAIVNVKLSEYVYLNTSIYENQAVLPAYMEEVYRIKGNIPGYARVKKLNGYSEFDYANAYGNVSFRPIKCLNFTIGYDRLFIGDGMHSMILSDYAAPMPYIKTSVKFGKWEYVNLVTRMMQYSGIDTNVETATKVSKVATYNMMIYNPQNGWQFTFFEQSVIDHKNKTFWGGLAQGVPVARILYIFDSNHSNNSKFGANISFENKKIGIFYSQLSISSMRRATMLDKYNWNWNISSSIDLQIGYKNHNLFNIKNLNILAEFNISQQWLSKSNSMGIANPELNIRESQRYMLNTNYGQSLTIPQNQDTYLFSAMLSYQIKCFKVLTSYNITTNNGILADPSIYYYPEYYTLPQDRIDFQFIYEMNPVNRMQWFAGISMYNLGNKPFDYYFSIGFRTALRNNY